MKTLAILILFLKPHLAVSSDEVWIIDKNWQHEEPYYVFSAKSKSILSQCKNGKSILFPNVMHAVQEIRLDGKPVLLHGRADEFRTNSIYGSPILDCRLVPGHGELEWTVKSAIKSFNKINHSPYVQGKYEVLNRADISHTMVSGGLFLFAIILYFWFLQSEIKLQAVSLSAFSLFMGMFFLSSISGIVGLKFNIILVDKIAASSLGAAIFFYLRFLSNRFRLSRWLVVIFRPLIVLGTAIIPFMKDGDQIQIILNALFVPGVAAVWIATYSIIAENRWGRDLDLSQIWSILGLLSFSTATSADIAYTLGLHSHGMTLGYGVLGSVVFFAQSMQTEIQKTYAERDYLRLNLESQVEAKTRELQLAQAELVQSAKLASLGTLSAGIAHEINNSINYVNGALVPIERMVKNSLKEEKDIQKAERLLGVMKDGLGLTVDIIKSLRTYTGLNQAKFKETSFGEVFKSVLTILNSKVRDRIDVQIDVDEDAVVFGSTVGLNQVVMNLVTNAIDAMPSGGTLRLIAKRHGEMVRVEIADSGMGMAKEVQERIFEPFYTTKDVGRGTGLGLYIVKKEVERHGGQLKVESEIGKGTTFVLDLPIRGHENREEVAA